MWYGTGGGLCRDNGFQVDVFRADREQADQMPSNDVLCIAENRAQHEIWFGTKAGAFILSKADYSIRAVDAAPFTLTDRHINALLAARDGSLWVSLRDSVLHFDSDDKLMGSVHSTWHGKKAQVTTLAETADGQIFVTQWNAGWGRIADSFEELPWSLGAYPSWIADDPAHACLWVGTWGEGIVKVSKEDFRPMPLRMSQVAPEQSRQVLSLQVDSVRGLLWSTTMSGLNAYKDSAPKADVEHEIVTAPSLTGRAGGESSLSILDQLYFDRAGNLWVPGFMPHTFIIPAQSQSAQVRMLPTGDHMMKVAVSGGLLWTLADRHGFGCYDIATGQRVECEVPAPDIRSFCADDKGGFLIGTPTGILSVVGGLGIVLAMAVAPDGDLWAVTPDQGLIQLHNGRPRRWADFDGFTDVAVSPEGAVFVGSRSGAVQRLNRTKHLLEDVPSLCNAYGDAVCGLAFDRQGHLWVASNQALRECNITTGSSRTLHPSDEEISLDFFTDVCAMDGDSVCLAGAGGFAFIAHSEHLDAPAPPLRIAVSGYTIDGTKHCVGYDQRTLQLLPSDTTLTLALTVFDPIHANDTRFAWRLGSRGGWRELPAGQNLVRLSGLSAGKHTLEVCATDAFGRWSEAVEVMTIHRRPAWWQTWWAYTLYIIIALSLFLLSFYLRRRRRLQEEEREREFRAQGDELERLRKQLREMAEGSLTASPKGEESPVVPQLETPGTDVDLLALHRGATGGLAPLDQQLLDRAHTSVKRNMDNTAYGVDQLAADLCMSRMNAYRRMKAVTGMSPSEFIRDQRLLRAAELLRTTSDSIVSIADQTGFSSASYFTKCFKEKYGVAPSKR